MGLGNVWKCLVQSWVALIKFHKIVGSNVPGLSSFVAFYNEVFSSSILDLERVNDLAMDMNINEKSKQDNF